jgi:hypothetical protein
MGIAQPSHTNSPPTIHTVHSRSTDPDQPSVPIEPMFPPSRNNPTISALEARRRLQCRADADFEAVGLPHHSGRRFVDMRTLLDALRLRDRGMPLSDIERRLGLEARLLNKLGRQGIVRHVSAS